MTVEKIFDERQREAIREATRQAEARTSGEIVTVVVDRCDTYEGALWKAAAFGSMLAALGTGVGFSLVERWSATAWWWLSLPAVAGALAGYFVPIGIPALHRLLVGRAVLRLRAERRAAEAFVSEEVFATAERSGVLLFVGLFEHLVEVARDREAQKRVPQESWDDLAERLAGEIRKGRAAIGLVQAIEDVGRLLELHGFERRADDANELDDNLRLFDA